MGSQRLGFFVHPIVLVNIRGFYDNLLALFDRAISERFMDSRHRMMWSVVDKVTEVLPALHAAPGWSAEARKFAAV